MGKTGKFLGLGAVVAVLAAVFLMPKKASASALAGGKPPEQGDQPKTAAEAYSLAMNPSVKDPDYVHSLALWLNSAGQRPDWAAAAEKRAVDLRAEQLLSKGLLASATIEDVTAYGRLLSPTHPAYATVLATRIGVERGAEPPAPFTLPLLSGGSLAIDMSIYRHSAAGGGAAGGGGAFGGGGASGSYAAPSAPAMPTAANTTTPPSAYSPAAASSTTIAVATPTGGTVTVPVQLPPAAPPIAAQELKPENDPNGTLALCRVLLAEQNNPGWKYVSPAVKAWQSKVGMKADGKFGPGAALRMAQETVVLPWVRYWSLGVGDGSKKAAINDFRSRLKLYAESIVRTKPEAAANLVVAADRESGQGWPTSPAAAAGQSASAAELNAAAVLLLANMNKKGGK
jgi:hypothetical protein